MRQSIKALQLENADLRRQISALVWDSAYGCYSRAGIEHVIWPQIVDQLEAIISFDIDNMHGLNTTHGQAEMDKRIKKSLRLRHSDFALIARIKSGDEGAIFVTQRPDRSPTDLQALCKRLEKSFAKAGITITAAIYKPHGRDFRHNIQAAFKLVESLRKARRLKGRK